MTDNCMVDRYIYYCYTCPYKYTQCHHRKERWGGLSMFLMSSKQHRTGHTTGIDWQGLVVDVGNVDLLKTDTGYQNVFASISHLNANRNAMYNTYHLYYMILITHAMTKMLNMIGFIKQNIRQ